MQELWQAFSQFVTAFLVLLVAAGKPLIPWLPLFAWVIFWLFGVNWVKFREILAKGGWIGLVLVAAIAVLVWGELSPPPDGAYRVFGLKVSNFVEKTIYVSGFVMIMFMAGSVQLSGCCRSCCQFDEPPVEDDHGHGGDHGHAVHGDAHGHEAHVAAH